MVSVVSQPTAEAVHDQPKSCKQRVHDGCFPKGYKLIVFLALLLSQRTNEGIASLYSGEPDEQGFYSVFNVFSCFPFDRIGEVNRFRFNHVLEGFLISHT